MKIQQYVRNSDFLRTKTQCGIINYVEGYSLKKSEKYDEDSVLNYCGIQ